MRDIFAIIFTSIRIFFIILLLSLCHAYCRAESNTLQSRVLEVASELVGFQDEYTQKIKADIDSVALLGTIPDSTFVQFIVNDIGQYFRGYGHQSAAIELFTVMLNLMDEYKVSQEMYIRLYIPLGAAYEEVGLWSTAMEYYHKALAIAQEKNMQSDMARIYNNIGAAYYHGDIEKAEEYMRKALDINTLNGDKKEMFLNYNNLAAIHMSNKDYTNALDYALRALQLIGKEEDAYQFHFMQGNIASLYLHTGDYHLAISYLKNTTQWLKTTNNVQDLLRNYLMLAEAYESSNMPDSALYYNNMCEYEIIPQISNSEMESHARTVLSDFYNRRGNYKKAYEQLHKATIIKDSLVTANDARKINNLEQIYANEQQLRENKRVIDEMRINKIESDRRITATVIILLVLIIFVIFLIIRSRLKEKLHLANEKLALQQITMQEKEKELQLIKEKELNKTIDLKNRELSSYALSYTKDNEFLAHLNEELKQLLLELNPRDKEHKEHIRQILTQLKQHCVADNWQEFRYYFEQVHPSFYDRLDEICPGITQRQKRLCAMLYIGLSTKEISSITFREVRSVESARNRLRKRLEVPQEESINEFLSRKLAK